MKNLRKIAVELYMLFHEYSGSISNISGKLGRNDSSRLSRQINPNDDRRDNFYIELLGAHQAMIIDNPELEEKIWFVLERERDGFRKTAGARKIQTIEHITKVFSELGDVIYKSSTNAPQEDLEKEAFELAKASEELYENIKEIQVSNFPS